VSPIPQQVLPLASFTESAVDVVIAAAVAAVPYQHRRPIRIPLQEFCLRNCVGVDDGNVARSTVHQNVSLVSDPTPFLHDIVAVITVEFAVRTRLASASRRIYLNAAGSGVMNEA